MNFSLTAEELKVIQTFASGHADAYLKEDVLESFTLNVNFSFSGLGRCVTCSVGTGPSLVISDDFSTE